jgi:DNA adenine methylase
MAKVPFQATPWDALAARVSKPLRAEPRPFLRWAGSKRGLLRPLVQVLPSRFRTYREPFMGSGSLFFALEPTNAVLSDSSPDLIETFDAVRGGVDAIVRHLKPLKPDSDLFYRIRRKRSRGPFKRAAEFIYLNKTGWNGLYRVNSKGQFNVPYGRPKTDNIADYGNLRACSKALARAGVQLRCSDFEDALRDVGSGDLVFLDPPYVTRHNNNGFVDYNEKLFSWVDQTRLASLALSLADDGVSVIVMNAAHEELKELYPSFKFVGFERASTLASDPTKRGTVTEGIFYRLAPGTDQPYHRP